MEDLILDNLELFLIHTGIVFGLIYMFLSLTIFIIFDELSNRFFKGKKHE